MIETSPSLLDRLRKGADQQSWTRLVDLYSPWIHRWVRRYGVQDHDADDVVQEVLGKVVSEMPDFQYDRERGLFRSWLRTITANQLRAFFRKKKPLPIGTGGEDSEIGNRLGELEDPHSALSQLWNKEHDAYLTERLMTLIEPEFEATTWKAFVRVVREGRDPDAVGAELGMKRGAVYTAKSRVLKRMREELDGMVE